MHEDVNPTGGEQEAQRRGWTAGRVALAAAVLGVVAALLWSTDRITMQGERTIYTVTCEQGTWSGSECSGRLAAGPRYAFRASALRREVIYWERGSQAPSGKFPDCTVADRDNWACPVAADARPATITTEMAKGRPTRSGDGRTLPYHSVQKWKWWLIKAGVGTFREARD